MGLEVGADGFSDMCACKRAWSETGEVTGRTRYSSMTVPPYCSGFDNRAPSALGPCRLVSAQQGALREGSSACQVGWSLTVHRPSHFPSPNVHVDWRWCTLRSTYIIHLQQTGNCSRQARPTGICLREKHGLMCIITRWELSMSQDSQPVAFLRPDTYAHEAGWQVCKSEAA